MRSLRKHVNHLLEAYARWLVRYSVPLLRISLGLIFLGFGVLKFFPGVSPAEALVEETVGELTFGLVTDNLALLFVATLETAIGICLLLGRFQRLGVALLVMAMVGILSPLVVVPEELFNGATLAPTLAGQYVLKDIVLLTAGLVVTANALGARMVGRQEDRPSGVTLPRDEATPSKRSIGAGAERQERAVLLDNTARHRLIRKAETRWMADLRMASGSE